LDKKPCVQKNRSKALRLVRGRSFFLVPGVKTGDERKTLPIVTLQDGEGGEGSSELRFSKAGAEVGVKFEVLEGRIREGAASSISQKMVSEGKTAAERGRVRGTKNSPLI